MNQKLDQKLKIGKVLEITNINGAIQYYKEVIELDPNSSQAKSAKKRIGILSKKE